MGEEEREGLSDFRRNAPIGLREALGRQYSEFMAEHPTTEGLSITDRDPRGYVEQFEEPTQAKPADFSLRIGSLKGQWALGTRDDPTPPVRRGNVSGKPSSDGYSTPPEEMGT